MKMNNKEKHYLTYFIIFNVFNNIDEESELVKSNCYKNVVQNI